MMKLSMQSNSAEIERKIDELIRHIENPRPALIKIASLYVANAEKRFASQTDPRGHPWKRDKSATIRKKARYGAIAGPAHVGVISGRLASSFKWRVVSNSAIQIFTEVPYARTFHYGAPARNTPARPALGHVKSVDRDVVKIISQYFEVSR